jgi:transcriptional regulator with XRE-family HTH domain
METPQTISIRNRIVGILVRRAREKAGKSQRECAEYLLCSPFTYSQCEQGKQGFSLPQLEALAYWFDAPLVALWDDQHSILPEAQEEPLPLAQIMQLRQKMVAVRFRQCRQEAGLSQRELADLLGCSAYMISKYEQGRSAIPLAELEVVAERCGQSLTVFMDDDAIPLGQAEAQRQVLTQLDEIPPDVRDFVLKPTNALYLRIAMLLSTMKAEHLRQIAETLLDITY